MSRRRKRNNKLPRTEKRHSPMPSSSASSGQQAIAPRQNGLGRQTTGEHGPIEFIEERLRVGGALRLFRLR